MNHNGVLIALGKNHWQWDCSCAASESGFMSSSEAFVHWRDDHKP